MKTTTTSTHPSVRDLNTHARNAHNEVRVIGRYGMNFVISEARTKNGKLQGRCLITGRWITIPETATIQTTTNS